MVYGDKGGYTAEASKLSDEVNIAIKDIIIKYYTEGMTLESIAYVVNTEVDRILLSKRVNDRINAKAGK